MWAIPLTLTLVSSCWALPAAQQSDSGLGSLITNVFGTPPPGNMPGNMPGNVPANTLGNNAGSDSNARIPSNYSELFSTIFGPPPSTTATTNYVGERTTPKPEVVGCECVPYYQCHNGTILTTGEALIDLRSGFLDTRPLSAEGGSVCSNYLEVCCNPPDKLPNVVLPTPSPLPSPTPRKGCGFRHPNGVGFRITGDFDNESQFGEFPWMVAIVKEEQVGTNNTKLNVYQCGGSLIHKQAVLTAAHCVNGKQPQELKIRAGEWDTKTKNEILPHQDRNVQSVIVHEKFHSGALSYDFAILILSEPVDLAENVDVVCLPEQNIVFDGSRCFASGWGKDKFNSEGHYQVILKKIDLPIVPHDMCQSSLRNTRLGKYFALHDSFICAGGELGKDTCKGDGGSPLVCPSSKDPNRYQQAGIVAWGIGCGDNGTPGVYGNVAFVRDWIDEQMAFNNLDNTVYAF